MLNLVKPLFAGLNKQQLTLVVTCGTFITVIGAVGLALFFKWKNRRTARARI